MSNPIYGPGIEITGRITPEFARILTPEAVAFAAKLQRAFGGRRNELLARRARAPGRARRRQAPRLPARDARDPRRQLDLRADSRRHRRPPGRDHRPRRPQDGHQRAQLRRQGVHGRLRGREHAALGQQHPGPDQPRRRDPPPHRLHLARGQGLPAERQDRGAVRAAARLAPAREAREGRRRDHVRRHLRLRALLLPQREGAPRARQRPVLLPAQAREPPRGAAVERRLRDGAGRPRHPARHDQGHGADRDDPRVVRDGRDPVRAARALGRPQLRALGLHLLVHQEVPEQQGLLPRRSRAGDDDHALPPELRRARDQDLPPAQHPRDGRHGGADPGQERRGRERRGVRQGQGRQGARGHATATTAPGSRTRASCRSRWRRSTGSCPRRTRSRRASART